MHIPPYSGAEHYSVATSDGGGTGKGQVAVYNTHQNIPSMAPYTVSFLPTHTISYFGISVNCQQILDLALIHFEDGIFFLLVP